MNREEFDAAVKNLEVRAADNRTAFKWGTAGWAALGFGYLLLVLTVSLGLTLGLLWLMIAVPNALTIKLGIIFGIVTGGLSWAILRGLFVRMEAPQGLRLRAAETPKLAAFIDELRRSLGAPVFHRVLLTGEHNAGVVQLPRLGVFGWHRNYLVLGLPLMQGVAVEEFRAILAHEFAHLSGAHGKFSAWLYRLRRTWEQVFDQLGRQQNGGGKVLGKFIEWFWPRFNARAFVLSRAQEYEADALAVQLTSPQALALGLIRTQVQGRWMEEKFWPEIFGRVREQAVPPGTLFHELGGKLGGLHALPETGRWLHQAYHLETNNADTHPCLKDRLRALPGLPPEIPALVPPTELPAPPQPDAATALLGERLETFAGQINEQWSKVVATGWQERHERARKLSTELAAAEASGKETPEAVWKRAEILLERDGDEAAQPLIERVLAAEPDHAMANFVRGRFLLAEENPRGVEHVERVLLTDPFATEAVCGLLYGYYERNGQRDRLKGLEQRLDAHEIDMAKAQAERGTATVRDTLLPPGLSASEQAAVRAAVEGLDDIEAVHIARKQVVHFPQRPMFLVALSIRVRWWMPRSSGASQNLTNTVVARLELPGHFLVFVVEKELKAMGPKVGAVSGSEIFRRVQ